VTEALPKTPASQPASFLTIQALRAVAALLVVLLHAFETWGQRVDPAAPGVSWGNGAAGVDVFFVISGFVMVISSRRLVDRSGAWLIFLQHRVISHQDRSALLAAHDGQDSLCRGSRGRRLENHARLQFFGGVLSLPARH
jgi:hypothetical protein